MDGKKTFSCSRTPNVMIIKYTVNNVTPTVRLSRYRDRVSTTYNATTAKNSNNIVYSMPYELICMDSLPGSFLCKMFRMSHGMPNDIKMANEFAPNEFETPTPPSPFRAINTLEMPSGMQPPAARKVSPITASGILNVKPENTPNASFNIR